MNAHENESHQDQGRHRKVMIVEDEPNLRDMLRRVVTQMEFVPECVGSAEDALKLMQEKPRDILILDLNLPGMSGLDLLEIVRRQWPTTQAIMLTGYGDLESAQRAIRLGVVDFLTKPCQLAELETALDKALRHGMTAAPLDPKELIKPVRAPIETSDAPASPPVATDAPADGEVDADNPAGTLDVYERQHILASLDRNGGNREATAAELGISVRTLYYRLGQYAKQGFKVK